MTIERKKTLQAALGYPSTRAGLREPATHLWFFVFQPRPWLSMDTSVLAAVRIDSLAECSLPLPALTGSILYWALMDSDMHMGAGVVELENGKKCGWHCLWLAGEE